MWLKAPVSASIWHAEVSWREKLNLCQLHHTKENFSHSAFKWWMLKFVFMSLNLWSLFFSYVNLCWTSVTMSGMDVPLVDHNETGIFPIDNGTFLRFSPTSASTSAAASSPGRPGNVYIYVWLFLGLLVFLLTLLIISLHRLKNIISSSSSVPDCSSEAGSSFTNMEICSISSQRSTISSLSTWGRWEGEHMQTNGQRCPSTFPHACTQQQAKHANTQSTQTQRQHGITCMYILIQIIQWVWCFNA